MKFKNINEYFNWLFKLERFGMKYNLSNITKFCKALGNPQKQFRSIHIAGTNGKGATASYISSILQEHGYKTGIFTSPHIIRYNERIRLNNKCIPDSYIKEFLNENFYLIRRIKPSFFEVNTAMAFKYFADCKIDAAVIECGLGGRLDSTNILEPDVIVITQIGIDHTKWLGNTINKIAAEKLGIVKPEVNIVVSDSNIKLKKLFKHKINLNYLYYLNDICKIKNVEFIKGGIKFEIYRKNDNSIKLFTPLPAVYQCRNAAAAYYAAKLFLQLSSEKLNLKSLKNGVKNVKVNTGYFGRVEFLNHGRIQYMFDISHNPDGIKNSIKAINKNGFKPDAVIFGIMEDKDHLEALKIITKFVKNIILTKPKYSRAQEPGVLYTAGLKIEPKINYMLSENVKDALVIARNAGYFKIAVMGSFFMVSDALQVLGYKKLPN
ncbi:MAG: hypothetical protein IT280_08610 [Ignavibacteria bacterium]|nr:hypothetical protein [Ignavibacteria bacterium]